MTTTTAHAGHHVTPTTMAVALAGALIAAAAGFGIANVVLEDAPIVSPTTSIDGTVPSETDVNRYPGFDPNGFAGTDREDRAFQHRR